MSVLARRLTLATVLVGITWAVNAQPQPSPGAAARRPPTPVTANFTGAVNSLDASDIRSVRFQYEAGARSHWHSHAGDQLLLLEQGRGRMQIRGQAMRELRPGEPVVLPGGMMHWHGAAPDQGLVQIAVNIGTATWGAAVTDAEYLGR